MGIKVTLQQWSRQWITAGLASGAPRSSETFAVTFPAGPSGSASAVRVIRSSFGRAPSTAGLHPRAFATWTSSDSSHTTTPRGSAFENSGLRSRTFADNASLPDLRTSAPRERHPRALCLLAPCLRSSSEGGSPNNSPSRLRVLLGGPEGSTTWRVKHRLKRHPSGG